MAENVILVDGTEQQDGIILLDYKDEPTAYYGREVLEVPSTVEGESVNYVREDLVPEMVEKTVELDFSGGDMTVTPEAGQAFSKVNIPVPEGLAPENIPEGMTIAGIVGAMVAGGGAAKIACGTFTVTASNTITHNLGVVPDFIILFPASSNYTVEANYNAPVMFGASAALKSAYPYFPGLAYAWRYTSSLIRYSSYPRTIDKPLDSGYPNSIRSANETTFNVDRASTIAAAIPSGISMVWIAIGGLT